MVAQYYLGTFLISIILMLVYLFLWHKHFGLHMTLIFVLVPVTNLGYALLAYAQTTEAALTANKLAYLGGCYLQLIFMLAVLAFCKHEVNRWVRTGLTALSTIVYLSALTIGSQPYFYKSVTFERVDGAPVFHKVYGPMHTVFIALVVGYFAFGVGTIIYAYLNKNQVSRKTIYLLSLTEIVGMISFFGGRALYDRVEFLPAAYDFALIVYLIIARHINLYDITDTAIDSLVQTGETGLASFDSKHCYLGSNETAKQIFPELEELTVDRPMTENAFMERTVRPWIDAFDADETASEVHFARGDRSYLITITRLYTGRRASGYQLFIRDDTRNQEYIKLLNSFNAELHDEVEAKTAHIVEMHDNLILSMAMMVESRDNSTGGHIRRTSEGVRILIEEMRRDASCTLSDEFCRDLIKAAPMHDLGKIAVDDAILRKPGRFTPEEFEQMKAHAAEGARIVHEILRNTDDEYFHHLAENVAHYHHERWDGSGYPEKLVGEQIPLEARIMAIADVYDALVSKRVYKERMSFEKANAIIMDGMGTQFDPGLVTFYVRARPQLEAYYLEADGVDG